MDFLRIYVATLRACSPSQDCLTLFHIARSVSTAGFTTPPMGYVRKAQNRLTLWLHRLLPKRSGFRPRSVVVSTAGYNGSQARFHALELYRSRVEVRPDLFRRLSPYFSYDVIDKLGREPAFTAEYAYGVAEIQNGRIYTDNLNTIAVMTADGTLLGDISYQYSPTHAVAPQDNEALRMLSWPAVKRVKGTLFSMLAGGGSTNNYGHWLIDALPRLDFLRRLGLDKEVDWYLVPSTRYDYQRDSLALLGIPAEKIVTAHPGLHLQADRLLATSHPRGNRSYVMPDWLIDWNRDQFLEKCVARQADKSYAPNIYITRRDTKIRNVENEAEVIEHLRAKGFEAYTMAELPFAEKVALFAQARQIVSVSGAGLNNLMFAQVGAGLVEIFPPGLVHTQYYQLARYNGLNYSYFISETTAGPSQEMQAGRAENVVIDLDVLDRALAEAAPSLQFHG